MKRIGKVSKQSIYILLPIFAMFIFSHISYAEVRTYEGVGEYIMSDFETPDIAKQRAKARAEQHAAEQAGVYVKSYTRVVNSAVTEDEIIAIANTIIKVKTVDYTTTPVSDSGGSIRIVAKIQADVDSERIDAWLKRGAQENADLIEQNKRLQEDKLKQDKEIAELKKKLASVGNEKEKSTIKKEVANSDRKFLSNQKVEEGWRFIEEKKYVEAIASFSQAIVLDEKNINIYYGLGAAYGYQGNNQQAMLNFDKMIKLNPKEAKAYNGKGAVYVVLGKYQEAIEEFNKAIAIEPQFKEAYGNKGIAYAYQCNYEKALVEYEKAIEFGLKNNVIYGARGDAYVGIGNFYHAIKDYTEAIKLNSNDSISYHKRAVSYAMLGTYRKAIDDCSKAIEINPQYADAYFLRGLVYQQLGKNKQAYSDFAKAEKLGYKK